MENRPRPWRSFSVALAAAVFAESIPASVVSWAAAPARPRPYPMCRVYLSAPAPQNKEAPDPLEGAVSAVRGLFGAERKEEGEGKAPARKRRERSGGLDFRSEDLGGQRFRIADVRECRTEAAALDLQGDMQNAFDERRLGVQLSVEFLAQEPPRRTNVREQSLAADYIARREAELLSGLCDPRRGAPPSLCAGVGSAIVSAPNQVIARRFEETRKRCLEAGEGGTDHCRELLDTVSEGSVWGPWTSLLAKRYLRGYNVPPPLVTPDTREKDRGDPGVGDMGEPWARTAWNAATAPLRNHIRGPGETPFWAPPPEGSEAYERYSEDAKAMARNFQFNGMPFLPPFPRIVKILSRFGTPRSGNRSHAGVDITCGRNEVITAPADGVVGTMFGYSGISGNRMWLNHGGGVSTFYAHLAGYVSGIGPGKQVKQGEPIAYCGMTGNAAGLPASARHLHYECRKDGVPYDPQFVCLPPTMVQR